MLSAQKVSIASLSNEVGVEELSELELEFGSGVDELVFGETGSTDTGSDSLISSVEHEK